MTALFAISRESGLDLTLGLESEWLETNGLGDFASSTLLQRPTRRYHGMLVVRPSDAEKRYVMFSRFEERLSGVDLSCTAYSASDPPATDSRLHSFELAPHPRATYREGPLEIVREIQMVRGKKAVLMRYSSNSTTDVELELRPVLPAREADDLTVRNAAARLEVEVLENGIVCQPYAALPAVHLILDRPFAFEAKPTWFEGVDLAAERDRGYADSEDHLCPGVLRVSLAPLEAVVISIAIETPLRAPGKSWANETRRRKQDAPQLLHGSDSVQRSSRRLHIAADDFLVTVNDRLGIDAGFPWFAEWGRDTFISLPGLTLARGDMQGCERVLTESLTFLQDGLLPNIFGLTRASSHYGSVDAALWYGRAVQLYDRAGGARELLLDAYLPALLEIATHYWEGTGLGIQADGSGLISAGSEELNATWMDAQTWAGPVTPRAGCAVEVNALWYSLLCHVELLLEEKGESRDKSRWSERRRLAKASFLDRFWLGEKERLADVWNPTSTDASIRPNMVLAAALELSPLTKAIRSSVVRTAQQHLLTPVGLRTLSPDDEHYQARFEGGPEDRDAAYHQGTVWPWLFGSYVEASLRAFGKRTALGRSLRATWNSIVLELDRAGLEHISEVFDGDAPHRPGGTIAQAWNTAELLRAHRLLEELGA